MNRTMHDDRRSFLRKFGLALGAISIGVGEGPAFAYQKKGGINRTPVEPPVPPVDFRNSPASWSSPLRPPGPGGQAYIAGNGGLFRPSGAPGSVEIFLDGAGQPGATTQRCEAPHVPIVRSAVSYGSATMTMTAFTSNEEDEGPVDNLALAIEGASAAASLRLVVRNGTGLEAAIEDDDDLPNGGTCIVRETAGDRRVFLVLDARPRASTEGDALVLTLPLAGAKTSVAIRLPSGESDADDLIEGVENLGERREEERLRWDAWKSARVPAGWSLPGAYGDFSVAAARILDQHAMPAAAPEGRVGVPAARGGVPDLVDEHFISEAELYLGRTREAKARLEAIWALEDERGQIIGAGGPTNTKEMCAAVYSLCRHAELTGDWTMFDGLYPDAFNALDALRLERERLAALPEKSANVRRNLLPEGSPGRGWTGTWEELTNSFWALIALKLMLDISDRRFLHKKSEIREQYGQMLFAVNSAIRETTIQDPAGYAWFPVVGAAAGGASGAVAAPTAGLGTLSLALFPAMVYKKDERMFQTYPAMVKASLVSDVPAGTGAGGPDARDPLDAALVAQALTWFSLPEDARRVFVGFLNHASPAYTWAPAGAAPGGAPLPDLRSNAETIRFLRHMMVLEDDGVLRLFEGIAAADLAAGAPLKVIDTPTRYGRASAALEPVDAKTWKASFRLEPATVAGAPELKSIEMPRVLGGLFRFDELSSGNAIKNGPRVIIEKDALAWEVMMRNPRRQ